MPLKEQIANELKMAMKNRDAVTTSVLRLLTTAIKNEEIAKIKKLTEEEALAVIRREVKQRNDAVVEYQKGGRPELAAKEEGEKKILEAYLPAAMSDEELQKIVTATIAETGAKSKADFGKAMKAVMTKTKGQADGQKVSQLVKAALG